MVDRSPYGYAHLELINNIFLPVGFVTVGQDMRGTQLSEGNFSIWHSDANDSQDLGDWIVNQNWSNGKVFSFGASADGLAAFTMVVNQPQWLHAQYFIWASSTGYDVIFPNGAYLTSLANTWIRSTVFNEANADIQILRQNEMRTDWWSSLDLTGKFPSVNAVSGFWAGWYDVFLMGNLAAYKGYNFKSNSSVRYTSRITIDPLGHCQEAAKYFPQNLVEGRTALAIAQAHETFGVYQVHRPNIRNVTFYVMSSNDAVGLATGQYWTSLDTFPKPTMTKYFFHPNSTVSRRHPHQQRQHFNNSSFAAAACQNSAECTTFRHDPTKPIPTKGGNNLEIPCGPLDQNSVDARPDVLVFQTTALKQEVALTGPIFATLYVGSDAVDTDFMVRFAFYLCFRTIILFNFLLLSGSYVRRLSKRWRSQANSRQCNSYAMERRGSVTRFYRTRQSVQSEA